MDKELYGRYLGVLREELVPALGCTEPVTVAYAAALARKTLGYFPEKLVAKCSGNIIKNVKSVVVPNSGGQTGIAAAAILGAIAGNADKALEVLSDVPEDKISLSKRLVDQRLCEVRLAEGVANLYVSVTAFAKGEFATVDIEDKHTHIVKIEKNGETLFSKEASEKKEYDRSFMSVEGILDFAEAIDINDVRELFDRQIVCNKKISDEGLKNHYGAGIGRRMLEIYGDSLNSRACAKAAAGSDASMNGCDLPVMINSGSGNQGITVSLPVVEYAEELGAGMDRTYRALAVSNLVAIHIKSGIGSLSAFCGAISASSGCGAAITYLRGGTRLQIAKSISNTLGIMAGVVCDGAKASCAGKIAQGVQCAILASGMALDNDDLNWGDGILGDDIEGTIKNIARMGRQGMKSTDVEILNIMIGN
ncbi:MAG: serine dehydratase subunit alpha family protein [Oscillospiraceae bacterium]|nr:serine dehydratase subunit alpha family protein [Oscillospiraceae bacterium]